jgi:hypothetical protein
MPNRKRRRRPTQWIDEGKGQVRLPIDRARTLIVNEVATSDNRRIVDRYGLGRISSPILCGLAAVFFMVAAYALHWASSATNNWKISKTARATIFDEDEPEGEITDSFPSSKPPSQSGTPRDSF